MLAIFVLAAFGSSDLVAPTMPLRRSSDEMLDIERTLNRKVGMVTNYSAQNCQPVLTMFFAHEVFVQCRWIDGRGSDVGYITAPYDLLGFACGYPVPPEALDFPWSLDLGSGALSNGQRVAKCQAPFAP